MNSLHRLRTPDRTHAGFALVTTLLLLALLVVVMGALASFVSLSQRSAGAEGKAYSAQQSALVGLNVALGELQAAAGPDQRVTATASILGHTGNAYTSGTTPAVGRGAWTGVWKSNTNDAPDGEAAQYSPKFPDTKTFAGWLVSATDGNGEFKLPDAIEDVGSGFSLRYTNADLDLDLDPKTLFKNVDPTPSTPYLQAGRVLIDDVPSGIRFFAFAVEDEGVKADLSWSETPVSLAGTERAQASRLSAAPGPDYAMLNGSNGPFGSVTYPLAIDSSPLLSDAIVPMRDPADLQTSLDANPEWLKEQRADITWGSRGVLCDVKLGGLRRDLSLAFEMDGTAESENATLFNQQTDEFVGNGDQLSSPHAMPGMTPKARHLFRDTPGAGDFFSGDITQAATVVRGPSWWLMRDYANLYKRLKASGTNHALDARAYFPNRSVTEDLVDMHAQKNQGINLNSNYVVATNMETNGSGRYAYRPVRANYAPVLLGVNAIYSLVYTGNQLKMTVDPFFIVWNPYNTQITADKFAITLENGFAGGMRFRHTDANGVQRYYGRPSGWGGGRGSDTSFTDFAKRKSGVNANVSYLVTDLTMGPGEVMIYSPPNESDRSSDANVLNDELFPGLNYDASTSGIFFNEFPEYTASRGWIGWKTVNVDSSQSGSHTIDVLFNIASQSAYAIVNIIETSLPAAGRLPNQLTAEANFGENVAGQEFRLNLGGGQYSTNINKGIQWRKRGDGTEVWPFSFSFSELSATKTSFGILSMLTLPTDYGEADTAMEVFSQLNATPIVRVQTERFKLAPLNIYVKSLSANGINNLMNQVGIDIDAFGSGNNGFYGKNYALAEGDTSFPLIDIPKAPLHSLVQLSGANVGTRLFEPTHTIGNSWKPPYIPPGSIYHNSASYFLNRAVFTMNDVSWQINDALFDRYYLSGIAPDFSIGSGGYSATGSFSATLTNFYGPDYKAAKASPVLQPHIPEGKTASDVVTELTPTGSNSDGYKRLGAYSLIKGAFNVNSTSVKAWSAFLRGNKDLAIESIQGTTDSGTGTPFPLSSSTSDTSSNNGWEKFSRLTDVQIDTLAEKIVDQVKARGPFMSLSDFVNRRIGNDSSAYQGALQEAIEQAGINGNQSSGIRADTSDTIPNYSNFAADFPYAAAPYIGSRNNATGVPMEVNQANILLPIAPKLSARSDTFRIRSYGEVRSRDGSRVISRATCEAVVQRVPEYMDPETDPEDNEPWDEAASAANFNEINKKFGRRFKVVQFRWLAPDEI